MARNGLLVALAVYGAASYQEALPPAARQRGRCAPTKEDGRDSRPESQNTADKTTPAR